MERSKLCVLWLQLITTGERQRGGENESESE